MTGIVGAPLYELVLQADGLHKATTTRQLQERALSTLARGNLAAVVARGLIRGQLCQDGFREAHVTS